MTVEAMGTVCRTREPRSLKACGKLLKRQLEAHSRMVDEQAGPRQQLNLSVDYAAPLREALRTTVSEFLPNSK